MKHDMQPKFKQLLEGVLFLDSLIYGTMTCIFCMRIPDSKMDGIQLYPSLIWVLRIVVPLSSQPSTYNLEF